ncbi:SDR family NAD(P)-dependent oxidoreductase, partial [Limosilactobacillus reuteri]|uniref:SDR family NAD(P)-dependent oxidoreductase n=1 Tax=Limosilactobacillus reuteri TaxID=1598 RepID=UPI002B054901
MGINFVKAALNVGDYVVATARKVENLNKVFTDDPSLVKLELDITDSNSVRAAINATVDKFGKIDVLLNNAGNFYGGYFEELSPSQIRRQFETNVFGTLNMTREVLPIMRKQQSGHVITISSSAGLVGFEFNSAY